MNLQGKGDAVTILKPLRHLPKTDRMGVVINIQVSYVVLFD